MVICLQLEVVKQELQNVQAAVSHAIKLEAFEQSLACQGALFDHDDDRAKRWPRTVCAVTESSDASETAVLRKHVGELQEALAQVTKGIAALAAGPWSGRAALQDTASSVGCAHGAGTTPSASRSTAQS